MKKLFKFFKNKRTHISNSNCRTPEEDRLQLINDYFSSSEVVVDKPNSQYFFPRTTEFSWENFEVYKNKFFPNLKNFAWLDSETLTEDKIRNRLGSIASDENIAICRDFNEHGYVIIKNLFPRDLLDEIWENLEETVSQGKVWNTEGEILKSDNFNLYAKGRILNIHKLVPKFDECFKDTDLLQILEMLLGHPVDPFQTINSFYGSEQAAHSDAVHMTTFPLGFMIAAWVAFEDLDEDCGPLVFYPGSHKLDYQMTESISGGLEFDNSAYEDFMKSYIDKNNLKPSYFAPCNKGDVLIWHHNLIHGGSCIKDKNKTRKSLVCHYFARDVIAYHEVTGRKLEHYDPFSIITENTNF